MISQLKPMGSVVILGSKEVMAMPTLNIDFDDDDTTYEAITAMANGLGISSEQLVKRAVAQYVGEYGLEPPPEDFKPETLRDLFAGHGLIKRKK